MHTVQPFHYRLPIVKCIVFLTLDWEKNMREKRLQESKIDKTDDTAFPKVGLRHEKK